MRLVRGYFSKGKLSWGAVLLVLLALGGLAAGARRSRRVSLSLGRAVELAAAGIRLRPFRGYTQTPQAPPQAFIYQYDRTKVKFEAYDPKELWLKDQNCGQFKGPGWTVTVARMRYTMPGRMRMLNEQHILAKNFAVARAGHETDWTDQTVKSWVETYAGKVKAVVGKSRGLRLRYPHTKFTFAELPPEEQQAYVLLLPQDKRVVILFCFEPGLKAAKVEKGIQNVLRSVATFRAREAEKKVAAKFQQARGRAPQERSAKFQAARQRVIASIENLEDWWYVETDNYVIKSNMTSRNRTLVKRIQSDIEILRKAYETFIPPIREIDEVSVVTVFNKRDEYLKYVPADRHWSCGLWMPLRRELVISPSVTGRRNLTLEFILGTVYHEAFHQYIFYGLDYARVPVWFNEGHAMLFEVSRVNRRKRTITVGENEGRLRSLEKVLKAKRLDLRRVMLLSAPEFYQKHALAENYSVSWGLVYFLRKAAWQYKGRKYAGLCDVVLKHPDKSTDPRKVSQAAMDSVDMAQLAKDFRKFWKSKTKRSRARRYRLFEARKKPGVKK